MNEETKLRAAFWTDAFLEILKQQGFGNVETAVKEADKALAAFDNVLKGSKE